MLDVRQTVSRAAAAWDEYWFGAVAASRPYLLVRTVLVLLAVDIWALRVPRFGYGLDGFNVAHFRWLDAVQPVPGPAFHGALMLGIGMLAMVAALTNAPRPWLALLAGLYTYGWVMSQLDSYQHHYLISLILIAFVCFPRLRLHDLAAPIRPGHAGGRRQAHPAQPGAAMVSAWAYALLGVNLAIVYAFTAAVKLESGWRQGEALQRLKSNSSFLARAQSWLDGLGTSPELFWSMVAWGTVVVEVVLAIAYLLAVRQHANRTRWVRIAVTTAGMLAIGFHASMELVLSVKIGWFSAYMILFAAIYLLPGSLLTRLTQAVANLAAAVPRAWPRDRGRAGLPHALVLGSIAAGAGVAVLLLVVVGRSLDIPGAEPIAIIMACAVAGGAVLALALRRESVAARYVGATMVATAVMWVAVTESNMRSMNFDLLAREMLQRGHRQAATEAYRKALRYAPAEVARRATERPAR